MTNQTRQLGLVTATALVIANMVGTGVFTTSGFTLGDLKSPWLVLAAWAVGGVLACLGALCYGALARRIPESGGEYVFLSRTVHPAAGYAAGWISLLVGFSAPLAGAAFAFGEYTKDWLPGWDPKVAGSLLIVLFAALHAMNVRHGAWVQNAAVLLKVLLIAGFAAWGLSQLPQKADPVAQTAFPWAKFAISLVWISFSYSGWNAAIYIGGEVKNPERNLPLALLAGTGLVTLMYMALNAVFVFSAPAEILANQVQVGRLAAQSLGGPAWANAVTALVALALVSSVSSLIMAGPRVYAKMAEDGWIPKYLAAGEGPPQAAILLQAVLALAMLWSSTFDALLTYIGFTLSLSTAATVLGLVRLRLREGPKFIVPGWPVVPGLFMIGVIWMAVFSISLRPKESLLGLATIALGVVFWALTARERKR